MNFEKLIVAVLVLGSPPLESAQRLFGSTSEFDCAAVGARMDDCFVVRGWIRLANGTRNFRVYPRSSRRIFTVAGGLDGGEFSPPEIRRLYSFDHSLWGDIRLCPLEEDRPGHMRWVCVARVDRWAIVDSR